MISKILRLFRRRAPKRSEGDFSSEIESHLQLEAKALQEYHGLSAKEAHNAALRAFGNRTQAQERFHESGRWLPFDHFLQDLRLVLRQLAKTPTWTLPRS